MSTEALETMCKELEEDLVLYYYGEIADDEKRRIDQHLGNCSGCGRFLEDFIDCCRRWRRPKNSHSLFGIITIGKPFRNWPISASQDFNGVSFLHRCVCG